MSKYEDGSYSSLPGIDLIAKVLAGRCQMHYTRAAAGKGEIPEGETPKTMTEPAGYVMDAMIAAVTNPVNGECQVTVQINSSNVEHGFYCTGILLYAEDPDLGEVPYTYLVLENGPEWIRPSSSIVGKLATFDLIAAVGDVDHVIASIDPDSVMTYEAVRQLIAETTADVDLEIPAAGWEADEDTAGEYALHCDIPVDGALESMIPNLTVKPGGRAAANKIRLAYYCRTMEGALRVYADMAPETAIPASLTLFRCTEGKPGSGGGGYILPTATETRLGGMKVGDGLSVAADGTVSVDQQTVITAADMVDEDEAEKSLKEILLAGENEPGQPGE